MKDCIQDFIASWKQYDSTDGFNNARWDLRLSDAGYYGVTLTDISEWTSTHKWCEKIYGKNHYAWTGATFWFESEKDATMFALRWS